MLKKIAPLAALATLVIAGSGIAAASTAAKEPAKVYGVCVSSKGAVRVLEARTLAKSRYGRCKAGETRLLMPGVDAIPAAVPGPQGPKGDVGPAGPKGDTGARGPRGGKAMPKQITFKRADGTDVCSKGDTINGNPEYACVFTPKPSPTPSPAS